MRQPIGVAAIILALALSAHAQELVSEALPDKPEPQTLSFSIENQPPLKRIVADKTFWTVSGAMAGAYAFDISSTAEWIHRCPRCTEQGWFDHGGRSLPKIAAGLAVFDSGIMFASYEWKRHVHNRVLNKVWFIGPSVQIEAHMAAAIHNQSALDRAQ